MGWGDHLPSAFDLSPLSSSLEEESKPRPLKQPSRALKACRRRARPGILVPAEIWYKIVGYGQPWCIKDLTSLARVTRTLLFIIRPLLYNSLTITSLTCGGRIHRGDCMSSDGEASCQDDDFDNIYDSLVTYQHLRTLVLEVTWIAESHKPHVAKGSQSHPAPFVSRAVRKIFKLLESCPALVVFSVRTNHWVWQDEIARRLGKSLIVGSLTTFRWTGKKMWTGAASEPLLCMFHAMKRLKVLELGYFQDGLMWSDNDCPSFPLTSLTIHSTRYGSHRLPVAFVQGLLSSSSHSLQQIDLPLELSNRVLEKRSSVITLHLRLPTSTPTSPASLDNPLLSCPNLQHFHLISEVTGNECITLHPTSRDMLPPTLQTLSFEGTSFSFKFFEALLNSPQLPELVSISHRNSRKIRNAPTQSLETTSATQMEDFVSWGVLPKGWTPSQKIHFVAMCRKRGISWK